MHEGAGVRYFFTAKVSVCCLVWFVKYGHNAFKIVMLALYADVQQPRRFILRLTCFRTVFTLYQLFCVRLIFFDRECLVVRAELRNKMVNVFLSLPASNYGSVILTTQSLESAQLPPQISPHLPQA